MFSNLITEQSLLNAELLGAEVVIDGSVATVLYAEQTQVWFKIGPDKWQLKEILNEGL